MKRAILSTGAALLAGACVIGGSWVATADSAANADNARSSHVPACAAPPSGPLALDPSKAPQSGLSSTIGPHTGASVAAQRLSVELLDDPAVGGVVVDSPTHVTVYADVAKLTAKSRAEVLAETTNGRADGVVIETSAESLGEDAASDVSLQIAEEVERFTGTVFTEVGVRAVQGERFTFAAPGLATNCSVQDTIRRVAAQALSARGIDPASVELAFIDTTELMTTA